NLVQIDADAAHLLGKSANGVIAAGPPRRGVLRVAVSSPGVGFAASGGFRSRLGIAIHKHPPDIGRQGAPRRPSPGFKPGNLRLREAEGLETVPWIVLYRARHRCVGSLSHPERMRPRCRGTGLSRDLAKRINVTRLFILLPCA